MLAYINVQTYIQLLAAYKNITGWKKTIGHEILERFSSFYKLQRITALCLRFKLRNKNENAIAICELKRQRRL